MLLATVVAAIATVVLAFRRSEFAPRVAKTCRVLAILVAALGLLGTFSDLALTAAATGASEISNADRSRMWSNGLAEALYNAMIVGIVAVPAFLVARWGLRRVSS